MLQIYSRLWGRNTKGEDILIYTLENRYLKVDILNLGAIIKTLEVKIKEQENKNIVISYDEIEDYEKNPAYIGAIIGRNAGRIKNAILKIENEEFNLEKNNGNNNLHGGINSISHKIWEIEIKKDRLSCKIKSPNLENGFPGNIEINVDYILKENELTIEYNAQSDRKTYINLTNHSYFNLSAGSDLIYNDILEVNADRLIKIDRDSVPYEIMDVKNSIFDFRKAKKIKEFFETENEQKQLANNGIDHAYILNKTEKNPITIYNEKSGIKMEIKTDNPSVVIYTANYFKDIGLKNHSAICFETQEAPNLFVNESLAIKPFFTDTNKKYERYTKFIFSEIE